MNIAKIKYVGVALVVMTALVFAQCGGGSTTAPRSSSALGDGKIAPKGSLIGGVEMLPLAPFQGAIKFPHAVSSFNAMDKGLFETVESVLKRAAPAIASAAEKLPKGAKIVVIGHADPIGGAGAARSFGYARALTVRNYLIKNGVPAARLGVFSAAAHDLQNRSDIKADENHRVTFAIQK